MQIISYLSTAHSLQFQPAQPVLGPDVHALPEGFDAGTDVGMAVNDHDAVRASPDGAKNPARLVIFGGVPMDQDARRPKRRGYGFALVTLHGLAIEGENHLAPFFEFPEDGVFIYSHVRHVSKPRFPGLSEVSHPIAAPYHGNNPVHNVHFVKFHKKIHELPHTTKNENTGGG
jgi:hypothetical protein